MQLTSSARARPLLAALALLALCATARAQVRSFDVHASSDAAGYADSDHVFILTPSIAGSVDSPTAGWHAGASYLVDIVSAASADIVSTASRRWTEVRQAGTLDAAYKPGTFGGSVAGSASVEPDYQSFHGGGAITQDLLDKRLTWLAGFDYGHDVSGRSGTPFSVFSHTIEAESLKLGLTLVVNRATVASFVGDVIFENGDSSKPYRYIPLFLPGTVVPVGASAGTVASLRVAERPLEQLPLSRDRYALSMHLAHRLAGQSTLRFDERLYDDSWALAASTSDARWIFDVGPILEIGPHLRLHAQKGVSFWRRAYLLEPGYSYPALRTGDRELGPLLGVTAGFSARFALGPASHRAAWVLGWDVNATETQYMDALYLTGRFSVVSSLSLEAEL